MPPRLLLRDFENDLEFNRHAKGKAGNSDYEPDRYFLDAENTLKQV